jgi:glucose/mannose-6-phosphate isomerase
VPIHIHRSYELPERLPAGTRTLVIASSFSGNTEETLSAYEAARAAGLPLAGVAAGGELEKRCGRDGVPFVRIPADPPTMQPRNATGYTVGILTRLLARAGLATTETVTAVERLGDYLTAFMKTARERGEALVPKLTDVTPVIYAADRFATVAQIWKIKLNENAKTPAFWNVFPELNHNEMIGWSKTPRSRREGRTTPPGTFHLVFLQAADDHPRVRRRFETTRALLHEQGISASLVPIEGQTVLEQTFSTLLVSDWASYGLALARGVDPSPVPMVEELKKRLKE